MPPTILARAVRRQMDHCILSLTGTGRPPGPDGVPDAYLSLYWVGLTTECGPAPLAGHLAYLWLAAGPGGRAEPLTRVLTDTPALAAGLAGATRPGRFAVAGGWPEPVPAVFSRTAASPLAHAWRIVSPAGITVEARWDELGAPVLARGSTRDGASEITTLLVSARAASLVVDGTVVDARPHPDPIWTPWFGTEQTSCVMGLGEVIHAPVAGEG